MLHTFSALKSEQKPLWEKAMTHVLILVILLIVT